MHTPDPDQLEQSDQTDSQAPVRLNILALPNQTKLYVVLMVVMIFTIIGATTLYRPLALWPLFIVFILLCFRWILILPIRLAYTFGLRASDQTHDDIRTSMAQAAEMIGLSPQPKLMVTDKSFEPRSYSSWRRSFVGLGSRQLKTLDKDAKRSPDYAQALILHELHHLKHGDTLREEFARALLAISTMIMGWTGLCLLAVYLVLVLVQRELFAVPPSEMIRTIAAGAPEIPFVEFFLQLVFPSNAEWMQLKAQSQNVNLFLVMQAVVTDTFPFFVIGLPLLVFAWRRLLRLRELHADSGVAQTQGNAIPMIAVMGRYQKTIQLNPNDTWYLRLWTRLRLLWRLLWRAALWPLRCLCTGRWARWREQFADLFSTHPSRKTRIICLEDPTKIYGAWWQNALFIACVLSGLELLGFGTSALRLFAIWPMHFLVIAALVTSALSSMLYIATEPRPWRIARKILFVVLLPHAVIIILTVIFLNILARVDPTRTNLFFNQLAAVIAGSLGNDPSTVFSAQDILAYITESTIINLSQVIVIFACLFSALRLTIRGMERIMTWYGYQKPILSAIYRWIALVAWTLALVILPPLTSLVLWRFEDFASLIYWGMIGLGLVGTGLGTWWFHRHNQDYAGQCPTPDCGQSASSSRYNACCPKCGKLLHGWLIAKPYPRIPVEDLI